MLINTAFENQENSKIHWTQIQNNGFLLRSCNICSFFQKAFVLILVYCVAFCFKGLWFKTESLRNDSFVSKNISRLNHYQLVIPNKRGSNDKSGNYVNDFVIKYENLNEDFKEMCIFLNIDPPKLQHTRNHKKMKEHYSFYYTNETKKLVHTKFSKIIERFNYEFNII